LAAILQRAQLLKQFIDDIFFNIYSFSSEDEICNFVNTYSNLYIRRVIYGKREWTITPPDINNKNVIHSLQFEKHPKLPFIFSCGFLEIDNVESEDGISTQELRILLDFHKKKEAILAFEHFCNSLDQITSKKRIQAVKGMQMVEFISAEDDSDGISLILSRKALSYNEYRLGIFPYPHKIHFK
jgi:hypothetical protein